MTRPQLPRLRVLVEGMVVVGSILTFSSCGDGDEPTGPSSPSVVAIAVTGPETTVVNVGEGGPFQALAAFSDGTSRDVTTDAMWSSSDEEVVTVSSTGLGSAVGTGDADICATYQGVVGCVSLTVVGAVPFGGTIFIDPDIITSSDPTAFEGLSAAGQGARTMFDRRVNGWITVDAYLFDATYDDGLTAEIQVNPEFGSVEAAQVEAEKYGEAIGRIPTALRTEMETVWIHEGTQPFGGGNNNILIHVGQAELYTADGILEETLVHEGAHTSLDAAHASAPGWLAAQEADATFISSYAQDFPDREDIAESFVPYIAVRYRADRIDPELANTILATMPNRIAYFDGLSLDMHPIAP